MLSALKTVNEPLKQHSLNQVKEVNQQVAPIGVPKCLVVVDLFMVNTTKEHVVNDGVNPFRPSSLVVVVDKRLPEDL